MIYYTKTNKNRVEYAKLEDVNAENCKLVIEAMNGSDRRWVDIAISNYVVNILHSDTNTKQPIENRVRLKVTTDTDVLTYSDETLTAEIVNKIVRFRDVNGQLTDLKAFHTIDKDSAIVIVIHILETDELPHKLRWLQGVEGIYPP